MASFYSIIIFIALAVVVYSSPLNTEKPFSCPENEEYYKCSQIHCYKKCDHLINHPACPSVTSDCYNPACECITDYLRDDNGICIPSRQCKTWTAVLDK